MSSNANDDLELTEQPTEQVDEVIDDNIDDNESENDYGDEEEGVIDEEMNIVETEEDDVSMNLIIVPKDERITKPFMTKYELVRIIGTRRKQLSLGAKPMVKVEGNLSINEIVDEEIKNKMIPFKIKRPLPDSNKIEIWDFEELEFEHLIH